MKFLIILTFLASYFAGSQQDIHKATYDVVFANNSTTKSKGELFIKDNTSVYYPSFTYITKETEGNIIDLKFPESDKYKAFIFKSAHEMYFQEYMVGQVALVEDDNAIALNDWIFTKETKLLGNYQCEKAIGEFRGRDYEIWFYRNNRIVGAPWKFTNIPGLVVFAKAMDGFVSYSLSSLNSDMEKTNMFEPNQSVYSLSLEQYIKKKEKEESELAKKVLTSTLPRGAVMPKNFDISRKKKGVQELIFDWEN